MNNPYVAVAAAALAAWIFGAVYYGVLGKVWQRAQGLDPEACKGQKMPLAPMAVSFVSELVMAFVFQRLLADLGLHGWQDGLVTGLIVGIAFMATTNLVNTMFQQRGLTLAVIDSGHWTCVAMIEGVVLAVLS
jgi:hypothetical protein